MLTSPVSKSVKIIANRFLRLSAGTAPHRAWAPAQAQGTQGQDDKNNNSQAYGWGREEFQYFFYYKKSGKN